MTDLPYRSAMPEFLVPRSEMESSSWTVEQGNAVRGDAWTDFETRKMRVPFGGDEFTRTVRAHEMMHAQVSPSIGPEAVSYLSCTPRAAIMAEDFRINTLCSRAGFDMDLLTDGSERLSGERTADRGVWADAVYYLGALAGTKAAKDFIAGVRKVNPAWASALTKVNSELVKTAKKIATSSLGSIRPVNAYDHNGDIIDDVILPFGFSRFTRQFGEILDAAASAGDKEIDDGDNDNDGHDEITPEDVKRMLDSAKGKGGTFAKLILDESVSLTRRVSGTMGRKRIASQTGRNPRRIHRIMTDPERRIFDRSMKGQGGIVVIDQSGSMSLSDDDIWKIVEAAPGCVIIGYSHQAGSKTTPNAWVLADRGKVCEKIRSGNGGNGVDGPVLRFAASKRRKGEPIIWVCDGVVTDGANDYTDYSLNEECAELVIKHGIHMVADVDDAVSALSRASRGERLRARIVYPLNDTKAWKAYGGEVAA